MDGVASELATSCQCIQRRRRRFTSARISSTFPLHSSTKRSPCSAFVSSEAPPTWLYLTVWVAAVLVYLNGLTGDFVHDDVSAIRTNPDVLGTTSLYQVFLNDYWGRPMADPRSHKSYRPLTILTFRLNHHLCGLKPLGFHLVNVLLHSCVCLLFTRLLLRLLHLPQGTVLSVALIFATHPIHTEAVTGLVGRADLLAAITFLAAILAYHRAIEDDNKNHQKLESDSDRETTDGAGTEEDLSYWDTTTTSRRYSSLEGNTSNSSSTQAGRTRNITSRRYTSLDGGTCSSNSIQTGRPGNTNSRRYLSLDSSTSRSSSSHTDKLRNADSKRYSSLDGIFSRSPILRSGNISNTIKYTQRALRGPPSGKFGDTLRNEKSVVRKKGELWRGGAGLWWVWRAGLLAGVGTLCKEHAITSLAFCAFWDIIQHRKHIARLLQREPTSPRLSLMVARLARLGLMCGGLLGARLWVGGCTPPVFSNQDNPVACQSAVLTRTLSLWYLPVLNVWLLLCPWQLSHDWQMGSVPLLTSLADPRNVATVLFYGALLLLVRGCWILKGSDARVVLAGIGLLVLPFLPATNLFFTVGFVLAERVLYIPSLGYSVVVGVGLVRTNRLRAPGLLLLLLLFSCRTLTRNKDWQDREALFRSGLKAVPHNAKMHYNFANLQKDLGNLDLARVHYQEAIRLWAGYSSAHNNLGTVLNDTAEAETHFRLALAAHPQHAHAHYNLAVLRKQQGETTEAVRLLEEILHHDPTNREAVAALAALYSDSGSRVAEGEALHLGLLASRPQDPVTRTNYAAFLHKIGRNQAAVEQYEAVLVMEPPPQHQHHLHHNHQQQHHHQHHQQHHHQYQQQKHHHHQQHHHQYHHQHQHQQHHHHQPGSLFNTTTTSTTSSTTPTTSTTPRDKSVLSSRARELVRRALEVGWEAVVGERLARLYLSTSRLMEAEATLAAILELQPHRHSAIVLMAQVTTEQRRYRESEELLRGVLLREPAHPEALQQLSLLYAHTNRTGADQQPPALDPPTPCTPAHECTPPLTARLHAHGGELTKEASSGGG